MTRDIRIGNKKIVFIEPEAKQQCDECGVVDELRPYGKNGACICYDCGMKPENVPHVKAALARRLGHDPALITDKKTLELMQQAKDKVDGK